MKVCITATGNTLEAQTDQSFGRAPWLILVETDTLAFEAIENTGVNASQGAGIAAAQMISNKGAEALLTGRVGPKARAALEEAGIAIYEGIAGGTVREALSLFAGGTNRPSSPGVSRPGAGIGGRPGSGMGRGGGGRGRCGGSGMGRGGGSGLGRGGGLGMGMGGGRCRQNFGTGQRRGR
jgi:predicted Fe-Mo cluster-binding NifX family protein